ncbi:MAG: GNAT family N-acetyltransferase [Chloroflexota bacterium]
MPLITVENMQVLLATDTDLDTVASIYEDTAQWLLARGIARWTAVIPRELLAQRIGRGETYLAKYEQHTVATMSVQEEDRLIWGDMPPDALYLHGLAVRRAFTGRGVGVALLRWAEQHAALKGKIYLRLDCMGDNPRLVQYYKDAGFTHLRTVQVRDSSCALFERLIEQTV